VSLYKNLAQIKTKILLIDELLLSKLRTSTPLPVMELQDSAVMLLIPTSKTNLLQIVGY